MPAFGRSEGWPISVATMRFDLNDLRLFLHVAESGSITRGAERCNLALASASARIKGMEAAFGTPLLERERRGVRPTAAGAALLHHARIVLQQIEQMRGELGEYARGLKGHIRLLCNTAALSEFLPDAIAKFLTDEPNIDIDLQEQPSYRIVQAIAEGRADLGVVADAVDLSGLETRPYRTDRLVLVTARRHSLARRRRIAFRDSLDYEHVGLNAGSALQEHLNQHAIRAGRPLKLRIRLRSFDAICRMVEGGVGIAVVPEAAAQRCRRSMAISIVGLTDRWALRQLTICARRFDALPAHAMRLVRSLAPAQ